MSYEPLLYRRPFYTDSPSPFTPPSAAPRRARRERTSSPPERSPRGRRTRRTPAPSPPSPAPGRGGRLRGAAPPGEGARRSRSRFSRARSICIRRLARPRPCTPPPGRTAPRRGRLLPPPPLSRPLSDPSPSSPPPSRFPKPFSPVQGWLLLADPICYCWKKQVQPFRSPSAAVSFSTIFSMEARRGGRSRRTVSNTLCRFTPK